MSALHLRTPLRYTQNWSVPTLLPSFPEGSIRGRAFQNVPDESCNLPRRAASFAKLQTVCDRNSTGTTAQQKEKREAGQAYFAQIQTLRQGLERNLFRFPVPVVS